MLYKQKDSSIPRLSVDKRIFDVKSYLDSALSPEEAEELAHEVVKYVETNSGDKEGETLSTTMDNPYWIPGKGVVDLRLSEGTGRHEDKWGATIYAYGKVKSELREVLNENLPEIFSKGRIR